MNTEISIIIPVYNSERTIERCVESLLYGKERNIEIILIDDCSKDNSWEICKSLLNRFENVRCIRNEENKGVSYTRNQGLKVASSKYLLFVDSDDWVSENYVAELYNRAEKNPTDLVICGHHFINQVDEYRRVYLWNENGNFVNYIDKDNFFELTRKFLLQQLWNKIFLREVIEQGKIRFDETQSMGEDFQFVLDYMEVLKCKRCVVINQPLYYYIRANNTSLMSQFGLTEHRKEYQRYEKLFYLAGKDNKIVFQKYQMAIEEMKNNFIYQIVRDRSCGRKNKLVKIEQIMQDGKAKIYYKTQKILFVKESVLLLNQKSKYGIDRLKGRIQREKNILLIKKMRKRLKVSDISIISQNCIGGSLYGDMGMEFLSPTINICIKEPDFIKFVKNLQYYMSLELEMHWREEHPIGMLNDVEIQFMHYGTCREAVEAWERRKKRLNWNRIIVFATDRDGFTKEVYSEWKKITYPKVLFTVNRHYSGTAGTILFPEYSMEECVPNLITKRDYYKQGTVVEILNLI